MLQSARVDHWIDLSDFSQNSQNRPSQSHLPSPLDTDVVSCFFFVLFIFFVNILLLYPVDIEVLFYSALWCKESCKGNRFSISYEYINEKKKIKFHRGGR